MQSKAPNHPSGKHEPTPEELTCDALNEQGFLLQQRMIEDISAATGKVHRWIVRAVEYPVSVPGGDETRIDLVLTDETGNRTLWHLVVECKRAHPDFKRWVFFDTRPRLSMGDRQYTYEACDLVGSWDHQAEPNVNHRLDRIGTVKSCELFNFYLEVRRERRSEKRVSGTEAIEDAFQQVSLGQAGLSRRLRETRKTQFRIAPVVVATADLAVADFEPEEVSPDRGMLAVDKLKLRSVPWLGVNFRVNDAIARTIGFSTNPQSDVAQDLFSRHLRTVFVVQSKSVNAFLEWVSDKIAHP